MLLDEVEKANVAVQEIFYQVFDKGMLQDDKGNEVNFKNTIILLTSNVGTDTVMKLCADPDTRPDAGGLAAGAAARSAQGVQAGLAGPHDRRAVLSRWAMTCSSKIIRLQLKQIADRMRDNHKADVHLRRALIDNRSPAAARKSKAGPATSTTS